MFDGDIMFDGDASIPTDPYAVAFIFPRKVLVIAASSGITERHFGN